MLHINYIIIIHINYIIIIQTNNHAVLNNNYGRLQVLILFNNIPMGARKLPSKFTEKLGTRPQKVSPARTYTVVYNVINSFICMTHCVIFKHFFYYPSILVPGTASVPTPGGQSKLQNWGTTSPWRVSWKWHKVSFLQWPILFFVAVYTYNSFIFGLIIYMYTPRVHMIQSLSPCY
jgi:hypothetical protein